MHKLISEAMTGMQGSYQYWGARLFSYFHAPNASAYAFEMQVDDAARLWVDNTLVVDASCEFLMHVFELE